MMHKLIAGLALAGVLFGAAAADEITFKKEFGGGSVQCQIYKETDDYLNYIDVKKDQDAGCARTIVEKVTRGETPLVDVEAFFMKKAAESKDKAAADAARAKAEEVRKAAEAAKNAKKPDGSQEKKVGKLTIRPMTEAAGVKVVPPAAGPKGSSELIVDPFPEEDKTPPPPPKSAPGAPKADPGGK